MDEFLTIKEHTTAEITEKKSKFIANLFYVENKNEAENIIKETKKKYHDARHNCIAYRVYDNGNIIEKSSDDGEPSGTAGAPMLEILKTNNLCNVLVIVTRYFGGVLLGTGGLVRAYTESTIMAVENSQKICKSTGFELKLELEYKEIDIFKYYCKNMGISITNIEYFDVVVCKLELEKKIKQKFINDIDTKKINVKKVELLCEKFITKTVEK